ncbi:hypothetical protein Mgra_00005022 [Meloidogyne graminicola]|uniref:BPTI/Kunitz inhibitor domain-containing protein n=1 Tax=Meloidogyne graminicola TaxID=189291 RepID=A0A8S9ZPV4_9BILA|nr:hypothetical protein Mgra_00005022 [Meloidogyne graminicola]
MFFIPFILFNLINLKYFIFSNKTFPSLYKYEIKPDIHPNEIFNKTKNKLLICKQLIEYGNCTKKLIRYFWNNKKKKCIKFNYSGCGGNQNNFLNKKKCLKFCSNKKYQKTKIIAKLSIKNRKKILNRKKELFIEECKPGYAGSGLNCTNDQTRWYFNINSGRCLLFWYGGCQFANSQNFFLDQQF